MSEGEFQCGEEVTDSSSDHDPRASLSFTFLDRGDASAGGVPGRLKAKVLAAVGLLVQADAHLAVALLQTKQQQRLNVGSRETETESNLEKGFGWTIFKRQFIVFVGFYFVLRQQHNYSILLLLLLLLCTSRFISLSSLMFSSL